MVSEKLLLGIDYGTGGCKVTVIDAEGNFVGDASTEFPTYHEHPGWSEQEPSDWWAALCESLTKLRTKGVDLSRVSALALDGSTHNAVLLGLQPSTFNLQPLRRTIMWTDQRATAECEWLRTTKREDGELWSDYIFRHCYQMPAPTWTLPQLMWLKAHEPETLAKTEKVLFVKDYVRYLLTGHVATDYIEAQGTLMFGIKSPAALSELKGEADLTNLKRSDLNFAWDSELVELAGLKSGVMPDIVKPTDVVGTLTAEAAATTGLPVDCKVVCGTSDSAVEDYGAGAVEPGDLIIKLATAGNVNSMTASAHPHPKTLTYSHVVPGMWYSVSATNAAALCQRWWRDNFYVKWLNSPSDIKLLNADSSSDLKAEGRFNDLKRSDSTTSVWSLINREAESSPVGANGVMFHPYLQGERCPYWDADLRASFTGVSISSTRGDFSRALMEGVAFSLRDCYRTLEEMKLPVKRIFLIGGGAKSKLWSEIVANVFNCTVVVPSPADASFGACLLAGAGTGVFADVKAAVAKCLRIDREICPEAGAAAAYAGLFERYRRVHDVLAPVYRD